jgi:hypothetical protein
MPGGTHRRWHFFVKGFSHQLVPEPEAVPVFGEHAGCTCLIDYRDQLGNLTVEYRCQIGDREIHTE